MWHRYGGYASWCEHAPHLTQQARVVRDVLDHLRDHRLVEGGVGKRKLEAVADDQHRVWMGDDCGTADARGLGIDADETRAGLHHRRHVQEPPEPASAIQHAIPGPEAEELENRAYPSPVPGIGVVPLQAGECPRFVRLHATISRSSAS